MYIQVPGMFCLTRFFKHEFLRFTLSYSKKMIKKRRNIYWQVIEKPTNNVVGEYFFEEDAHKLVKFQNKNKVWQVNGGIPRFLWTRV